MWRYKGCDVVLSPVPAVLIVSSRIERSKLRGNNTLIDYVESRNMAGRKVLSNWTSACDIQKRHIAFPLAPTYILLIIFFVKSNTFFEFGWDLTWHY